MNINLEESTTDRVAPLLNQIIYNILSEAKTFDSLQKDFFFILVVVSMTENGFVLVDEELVVINPEKSTDVLLSQWKSPVGTYQVTMLMKQFDDITLKVIMSSLGSTALVNVIVNELNETYSICLPISRYVVSPQATTIPMIFRDLKHFSTNFKNKVISAVKSRIFAHHGFASASLTGLPEEVLFKIMINLPVNDIISVSKTSRRLRDMLYNEGLWYTLYRRDFPNTSQTDCTNWKEMYKTTYLVQLDKRLRSEHRRAGHLHDLMDHSDYMAYIDNPMWNII